MQQQALVIGVLSIIIVSGIGYTIWNANQEDETDFKFQDYGLAPDFTLDNMNGDEVTFKDHDDKVRLLTFIYTRCTEGCGTITVRMLNILFSLNEQNLQDDVEFFVVNFDYMHDNASVLQDYAQKMVGDDQVPSNMEFLHGTEPEINKTATDWDFFYQLDSSPMMHTNMSMEMNDTMSTDMEMNDTMHMGHEVVWIHPFVVYVIDKDGEIVNKLWGLEWEQKYVEDMVKALL